MVLSASTAGAVRAQPRPADGRPVGLWSSHASWPGWQLFLGPTGARGWLCDDRIVVTAVPTGSPAEGRLQTGDVIVGAGGEPLAGAEDPRRVLGEAITAAETKAGGGRLRLKLLRQGRPREVTVPIRVMGRYSDTWPYDCEKSKTILREACARLARQQFPDGHVVGQGAMATAWSALLWLAADDADYLDNARRAVYDLCRFDYDTQKLRSWALGYGGMAIAEYYLKTGDASVLAKLQDIIAFTEGGQMASGTWGHNVPWGAYGGLNQAGLPCWIMLTLGAECGLKVDPTVHAKATRFFAKYIGRGGIPYGDHLPTDGNGSNGKDALGAVGFALLGHDEGARFFARLVAASYRRREYGHTGCFLSLFWGPVAAPMAGEKALRRFLDHQKWYYDLARTPDGGLTCQPNAENLSGRTPGTYTWYGPRFTTGGMGLLYALPHKAVRVMGAPPSVFGRRLTGPIARARTLYQQRRWPALAAAIEAIRTDADASAEHKRFAEQLGRAAERQRKGLERTLAKVYKCRDQGDPYFAKQLLLSLQRRFGAGAAELAAAAKRLGAFDGVLCQRGEMYYKAWADLQTLQWQVWHFYGKQLAGTTYPTMPAPTEDWAPLAPARGDKAVKWRLLEWDGAGKAPVGWGQTTFDDSAWVQADDPVTTGTRAAAWTKANAVLRWTFELPEASFPRLRLRVAIGMTVQGVVALNGTPVIRLAPGPGKRPVPVELPSWAAQLLRPGKNVLAFRATKTPDRRGGQVALILEGLAK